MGKTLLTKRHPGGDEPLYEDEDVTFKDTKFIRERERELAEAKEGWDLLCSSNTDI